MSGLATDSNRIQRGHWPDRKIAVGRAGRNIAILRRASRPDVVGRSMNVRAQIGLVAHSDTVGLSACATYAC
jgi:hypothetical protein